MSVLYLLDTNIASYLIRGGNAALQARIIAAEPSSLCVSSITEAELHYGVARKPGAGILARLVQEFLARVEILAWESAAAHAYGALRADLERSGLPLGNLDTLIAAHALSLDATLVCNDQVFPRIPALKVENWATPS